MFFKSRHRGVAIAVATALAGGLAAGPAAAASHAPPKSHSKKVRVVARKAAAVSHLIFVQTGSQWGAGTDGDVHITLKGANGTFGPIQLDDDARDNFERNQADVFVVTTQDIGALTGATVHLQSGDDWNLARVDVLNLATGVITTLPAHQWLTARTPVAELRAA
jgi:hypothetical protein